MRTTPTEEANTPPPGRVPRRRTSTSLSYEHPILFWISTLFVAVGVTVQLPMFFMAGEDHYRLHGMMIPTEMYLGMLLIVAGGLLAVYSLYPRNRGTGRVSRIRVQPLDDTRIRHTHIMLLVIVAAAVAIDGTKPITLAFTAPGASAEYGLRGPLTPDATGWPIALYALAGISGTTIGSFVWGWLGDRIGRRASILLAGIIFIGTSTCGTMPEYWLNLATCFIMGLGVGGMLPIAYALMSETIPARHRGWVMVLIGGGIAGAYVITSWAAATIGAPDRFGWRVLWLIGLPTGVLLILLNRWIPESPRFLLQQGRDEDARIVMNRYGARVVESEAESELEVESEIHNSFRQVFTGPFLGFTAAIVFLGLSIGLTTYGFQQWIPSNLQKLGFSEVQASRMLLDASLIGLPLTIPVALLYGFWSSKKTIALLTGVSAAALAVFVITGGDLGTRPLVLQILLVVPIWGVSILNGVILAYAVEIYPTRIRSRGSGMSAGMTKFGGVTILVLAAGAITAPSIRLTASLALVPMTIAIITLIMFGPETKRRRLEDITAEELRRPGAPVLDRT